MSMRVLLVDDHEIVRQGLRSLIGTILDIELVGEAENGSRAVALARETNPDVVLMDISLPDITGIEAAKQIVSENPETNVLALSMHSDQRYVKGRYLRRIGESYPVRVRQRDLLELEGPHVNILGSQRTCNGAPS